MKSEGVIEHHFRIGLRRAVVRTPWRIGEITSNGDGAVRVAIATGHAHVVEVERPRLRRIRLFVRRWA